MTREREIMFQKIVRHVFEFTAAAVITVGVVAEATLLFSLGRPDLFERTPVATTLVAMIVVAAGTVLISSVIKAVTRRVVGA